ncbi:glycoside hydrolase family 16 protein [Candidatus Woesebacteria bacterium]|nr:glycoside hydrolase family 16 protein [Candidatus Woesebacteria bacterium]
MNKRYLLTGVSVVVLLILVVIAVLVVKELQSPFVSKSTFEVHFKSRTGLNQNLWNFEQGNTVAGYNKEEQTYTTGNCAVSDDVLTIFARRERKNERDYTSCRINLFQSLDVNGGKFIVIARFPKGIGTFPAIWLRTSESRPDGKMTAEIDIAEAQGARPGIIFANVHTKGSVESGVNPNQGMIEVPDMYDTFHEYGVEWTPDRVIFTLDGKPYHEVHETIPYKLHLVMNLAMGGNWAKSLSERLQLGFPNGIDDGSEESWKLMIKDILYYPLKK